jgi:bifunctional non-homologous end joining protein LigD
MLATRWEEAFDDEDWWFEVKWDGYRAIVANDGKGLRVRSRRGQDLGEVFPELRNTPLPNDVVVDGEVVAFDADGHPSFSLLQRRPGFGGRGTGSEVSATLVVFDLLHQGESMIDRSYEERRERLSQLSLPPPILVPEPTAASGSALFAAVKSLGVEGIVGKRLGSSYFPGRRSPDWRKVAVRHRLRAVIGGFLPGHGGRGSTFGSLLVGLQTDDGLRWIGAVGSGFDEFTLRAIKDALEALTRPSAPFVDPVAVVGTPVWVDPAIVIAVEYKEWTLESRLRAPVFKGVVLDDPESVTWEAEGPV